MQLEDALFIVKGLEKGIVCDAADPLTFEKELIYQGTFKQPDGLQFSVDNQAFQHWHNTFLAMSAEEIEVPVAIGHSENPEHRRGTLKALRLAKNSRGLDAVFGKMTFRDAEAAKLALCSDVSIYAPKEFKSGKGTQYYWPLRHIAITDYPVIPGLEKFKAIAASLVLSNEVPKMNAAIIKKLGVDEKLTGADLDAALEKAIDALIAAAKKPEPKPEEKPAAVAASLIKLVGDSRATQIDSLVNDPDGARITPAVAAELKKQFCNPATVAIVASHTGDAEPDGFAATLAALKLNTPVLKLGEKSGPQGDTLDPAKNPLIANAEKLAAEAKAGR